MKTTEVTSIIGKRFAKPMLFSAEIGLFSFGEERGWHHPVFFPENIVEGAASVREGSRLPLGLVFRAHQAEFVHVLTAFHREMTETILCFRQPRAWLPDRLRLSIEALGMISPIPETSELLRAALSDFGRLPPIWPGPALT